MSERALKSLVAGLAAAMVAYVIVGFLSRDRGVGGSDPALEAFLQHLGNDTLASVTLTSPAGVTFHLVHAGAAWAVNDLPADSTAVSRLQRSAREAKIGVMISSSEANQARLGVVADSAWTLEVQTVAGETARLLVGHNGSRMSSVYVRLPDEAATWELTGDIRGAVARTLTDWRDKAIAHVDTAGVGGIDVTRDGGHYTITRRDSAWVIAASAGGEGEPAEASTVSAILSELAGLDATGFATDTTTTDSTQYRQLTARSLTGDTLLSIDAAGTSAGWHVTVGGNATLFDVPAYRIDRLLPKRDDVVGKGTG
jgi:Domain of unknown function (DUF4340)